MVIKTAVTWTVFHFVSVHLDPELWFNTSWTRADATVRGWTFTFSCTATFGECTV